MQRSKKILVKQITGSSQIVSKIYTKLNVLNQERHDKFTKTYLFDNQFQNAHLIISNKLELKLLNVEKLLWRIKKYTENA